MRKPLPPEAEYAQQQTRQPGHPRSISRLGVVLLVMTTLATLVAFAFIWATQRFVIHSGPSAYSTIDDARRAVIATPLFWTGVSLLALAWIALWRWLRWRYVAFPIVIAIITVSLAGLYFWRSQTIDQPVHIGSYQCAPTDVSFDGRSELLQNCVRRADAPRPTLGTFDDRERFVPQEIGSDAHFTGLPVGTYRGHLTTTAPLETTAILLAQETHRGAMPVQFLAIDDPFGDESRTWSTSFRFKGGGNSYVLLYYISSKPALPDAKITFDVHQCTGTTPLSFEPTTCSAMTADDWILQDVASGTRPQTFRQPVRSRDGSSVTYSNLEARAYQFNPLIGNKAITTVDYGFLVLPLNGPQTADASILEIPPNADQEEFSVKISAETLDYAFAIYIFPVKNTYAAMAAHQHIATLWATLTP